MPSFPFTALLHMVSGLMLIAALQACVGMPSASAPATTPPVSEAFKQVAPVKIGLVLGGGAARGFAHIGVIKVLESQGFVPDIFVGTRAGSVVGAHYAAGNNGFALHKMALKMEEAEAAISDWIIPLFSRQIGVSKGRRSNNMRTALSATSRWKA